MSYSEERWYDGSDRPLPPLPDSAYPESAIDIKRKIAFPIDRIVDAVLMTADPREEVDRLINDLLQTPEFCTALAMITYNDRDPLNLTYRIFGPLPRWGRAIANILPTPWRH